MYNFFKKCKCACCCACGRDKYFPKMDAKYISTPREEKKVERSPSHPEVVVINEKGEENTITFRKGLKYG